MRFAQEDRLRSWSLFLQTLVILVGLQVGVVLAPLWAAIPMSLVAGLVSIRLFIFFHDHQHGAILRRSKIADGLMHVVGIWLLAVSSVWKETHDYHHRNNARLIGSAIGSYPVVTPRMWRRMSPAQKRTYRVTRHPLTMAFGYFTVFVLGMALSPFRRDPSRHWMGPLAIVTHAGLFVLWGVLFGWTAALLAIVVPVFVATGLGSYLFYAQHNFPDVEFFERRAWTFDGAALRSSSMFEMPALMHWFTGNIGYHHIHHLNHRIPFYRLPEAMQELPELQKVGRTSWRPADIAACLRLAVWDPHKKRMLTWRELR